MRLRLGIGLSCREVRLVVRIERLGLGLRWSAVWEAWEGGGGCDGVVVGVWVILE